MVLEPCSDMFLQVVMQTLMTNCWVYNGTKLREDWGEYA